MFDALQDTPRDFQIKLIGALNSLSQTMGVAPGDAFNQVLCASNDENQDVKKNLYNWWRAFFEVLGKVSDGKMPKDREDEYNGKIDDLMAEIMKAGDAESTKDEVVMESTKPRFKKGDFVVVRNGDDARVLGYYRSRVDKTIWYQVWVMDGNRTTEYRDDDVYASREEYEAKYLYEEDYEKANKSDEDDMLKDFDFAVQHIGEIANRVKDVVNFVNPYCESMEGDNRFDEEIKKVFDKAKRLLTKYRQCAEEYIEENNTERGGAWGSTIKSDHLWKIQKEAMEIGNILARMLDWRKMQDLEWVKGVDYDKWKDACKTLDEYNDERRRLSHGFSKGFKDGIDAVYMENYNNEVDNTMKNTVDERGDSEWVSMDDLVGKEFGESDDADHEDVEPQFKVGDKVCWTDPETDETTCGWTVIAAPEEGDASGDEIYTIEHPRGSEAEVYVDELEPDMMVN